MQRIKEIWSTVKALFGSPALEMLVVWAVSNLPIGILYFTKLITTEGQSPDLALLITILQESLQPGEVIVYLSMLMAPVLWILLNEWRGSRHYPLFLLLLIGQALVLLFTGILYSAYKTSMPLNSEVVSSLAWIVYLAVMLIWFITLVYRNHYLTGTPKSFQQSSGSDHIQASLRARDSD